MCVLLWGKQLLLRGRWSRRNRVDDGKPHGPHLIRRMERLLSQRCDEDFDLVLSDRPLLFFSFQFEETIPFMTGNFKTVFSHRRVGEFAFGGFLEPLGAELGRIFERRHFEHDINGGRVRSEH